MKVTEVMGQCTPVDVALLQVDEMTIIVRIAKRRFHR